MWTAAIDDTHLISPTLVLNFRLGFTRYTQDSIPNGFGFDPGQLGLPASVVGQLPVKQFPLISFSSGYRSLGAAGPYVEHDYHYFLTTVATWSRAAHTMKYGFEAREQQNNIWNSGNAGGAPELQWRLCRRPRAHRQRRLRYRHGSVTTRPSLGRLCR